MTAIIVFKENRAARYGLPKFQKTLTGKVIFNTSKIISIVPLRCTTGKSRNFQKTDLISIDIF